MFQKLKYIWVIGGFVVGMQSSYAQVATNIVTPPLPTADVPVHYAVPELTGNAEQDAEIQQVRSRDYETFQSYEAKANEILQAFPSIAAREYLYSVGMPRLTYTGNAYADWQTFKAAFKTWQKVNSEYLSLFEQRATEINRQSPAPQSK